MGWHYEAERLDGAGGAVLLASDLPPFRELIDPGVRGMLFTAGQRADFIAKTLELLGDVDLRVRLGATARDWVTRERQWPTVVASYRDAYRTAMSRSPRSAG